MNMNREEALAYGKGVINANLFPESQAFWKIAVEALEQAPCGDAISRQTALEVVEREEFKGDAISEIEKLPPVTSQPCSDAISRQAVLEELPRRAMKNYFGEVVGDVVYIDDIKALPPVTPQAGGDVVSRQAVLDALDKHKYSDKFCEEHHIDWSINLGMAHIVVNELKPVTSQPKMRKCKWVKYDHRTICPKEHDADDPYWRIPENRKDTLKYCPYCGLEIVIDE